VVSEEHLREAGKSHGLKRDLTTLANDF